MLYRVTEGDERGRFRMAVEGLLRGNFSASDPLFATDADPMDCPIVGWYAQGWFEAEPQALAEALACACFNGRTDVARFLLDHGVDPLAGHKTGLDAVHWAVNRGQLEVVRLLLERGVSLEHKNMYGGTVLGVAVWSAVHEPRRDHLAIIEALLEAGADVGGAEYPSGRQDVDEVIRRHQAE